MSEPADEFQEAFCVGKLQDMARVVLICPVELHKAYAENRHDRFGVVGKDVAHIGQDSQAEWSLQILANLIEMLSEVACVRPFYFEEKRMK